MNTTFDFGHIVAMVGDMFITYFWNQPISFYGLTTTCGQIIIWSILAGIFLKFLSGLIGDNSWF